MSLMWFLLGFAMVFWLGTMVYYPDRDSKEESSRSYTALQSHVGNRVLVVEGRLQHREFCCLHVYGCRMTHMPQSRNRSRSL